MAEAEIDAGDGPAKSSLPDWYPELLDSVSAHIVHGHRKAVKAANAEVLLTYWSIGREILERQQQEGWGARERVEQGHPRPTIETRFHERAGNAITNFAATLPPEDSDLAQHATRDPYLLRLLEHGRHPTRARPRTGPDRPRERFLLEMGQGFALVSR